MNKLRILANDGIDARGKSELENAGFEVVTDHVPANKLAEALKDYDALLVRSATKVTAKALAESTRLRLVGRAGVGMDNIDHAAAAAKKITVVNTPAASSRSVAELVFAHALGLARMLHQSNAEMPTIGNEKFNDLKKNYSKGIELSGRTLGVVGFGRIGQETARIGRALGMSIVAFDLSAEKDPAKFREGLTQELQGTEFTTLEIVLSQSDIISIHVPGSKDGAMIGKKELALMRPTAILINCARGGVVDEDALLEALNTNHLAGAGLDVFANEPTPRMDLLRHPKVSASPHIGASTGEAQERIGMEMAQRVMDFFAAKP